MATFAGESAKGFDDSYPWQMVPVGQKRTIELVNGKGFDLSISPPGVASFESGPFTGLPNVSVTIKGDQSGGANLKAKGTSWKSATVEEPSLEVAVLESATVSLKFYSLKDEAGNSSQRSSASVGTMFQQASTFYETRANVTLKKSSTIETITLPGNQSDRVTVGPAERKLLQGKVNLSSADLHVFLVWGFVVKEYGEAHTPGYTPENLRICLIEDDGSKALPDRAGLILAHELGHFLGGLYGAKAHDFPKGNLMYFDIGGVGPKLTKDQILVINKRATKGLPAAVVL